MKATTTLCTLVTLLLLSMAPAFSNAPPTDGRRLFSTPDEAAAALIDAAAKNDLTGLLALFGPSGRNIVMSGDPVADRLARQQFIKMCNQQSRLVILKNDWAALMVGTERWLFPVPVVKAGTRWYFDTAAGIQELLDERVGRNELFTIGACHAFVDAEFEYELKSRDGRPRQYAQTVGSAKGAHDGLYWPAVKGQPDSPLGPLMAEAASQGYKMPGEASAPRVPFHGYYYRILTAQGEHAPGGRKSYLNDGKMTGGFALVAWPASYGSSGVMTFIISSTGIVYQRDLGAKTPTTVQTLTIFDPDKNWTPVYP